MQYPRALAQAVYLRRTALRLPEPAGLRAGVVGNGSPLRLLVLGDSSAVGVGVKRQEEALTGQLALRLAGRHRVEWRLTAMSGATTGWAVKRLRAADLGTFDVAVVALGVNDVKNGVPQALWARNSREILRLLEVELGVARIYQSALPPVGRFPLLPDPLRRILGHRAERFDAELRSISEEFATCRYLPFDLELDESHMAEDGFHPGQAIYSGWAERVDLALQREPLALV